MDETTIKKMRGRAKSALTRIINSFNENLSKPELLSRIERLDQIFKDFDNFDSQLPDEVSEIEDFENKYFEIKAKYQNAIDAINCVSVLNQNDSNNISVSNFKLPRLSIPQFTGKYTDWLNFKDLFLATVHDNKTLAKIQKFQYLIGLLADEPASIIKHIPISETTYEEAWNKLICRYDRKNQIVSSLIKTFLDQPSITHVNSTNLRQLTDTSDEVVRGLKSLGDKASARDVWLIYLLLQKVDAETRQLWSQKTTEDDFPSLECFLEFLNSRCVSLEIFDCQGVEKKTDNKNQHSVSKNILYTKNNVIKCLSCNGSHALSKCYKFKSMDIYSRKNLIRKNFLCFNCFSSSHQVKNCTSHNSCNICKNFHHTLLHENKSNNMVVSNSSSVEIKNEEEKVNISSNTIQGHSFSFLPTAVVNIFDSSGMEHECTLLLDSGSEASFVSGSFVRRLGLKRKNARICVKGLGACEAAVTRGCVNLNLRSKYGSNTNCVSVQAFILDKLTSNLPSEFIDTKNLNYLNSINLADPNFSTPKQIDLIIGADYFFSFILPGQLISSINEPIAQNSIFGWVISGKIQIEKVTSYPVNAHRISLVSEDDIDATLKRFWQLEELPSQSQGYSEEEEFCEDHFKQNYRVNDEGRFVVKLPIFDKNAELGNSKPSAVSRFLSMEHKFDSDKDLEIQYKNFMLEYINLNHMTPVTVEDTPSTGQVYYLPHHSVVKPDNSSTKLRVVFDGSCKAFNSVSLNSILGVGPTIQNDIFSILLKFRMHKFAFSADIEKMYRQILISPEDQNLQRIVWRDSFNLKIQDYKLCTVTYGTASAPFLAIRCLWQIAMNCEKQHPEVASIIKRDFYVDDCLSGSSSLDEVIDKASKLSNILGKHGFHLRKWRTNANPLLDHLAAGNQEKVNLEIHADDCAKTLGLLWDSKHDIFKFKVTFDFEGDITKRKFLSQSSKLFDSLGLLSPCTITIKIFYQQLWVLKLDWDSQLPDEWKNKLLQFQNEFRGLDNVQIPRWLHTTSSIIHLHGFCDASELAYAAIIYCSQSLDPDKKQVNLMVAKTKVAPIKQVSIPRLELLGALLLTRLYSSVFKVLSAYNVIFHVWTDSKVVLSWLATHPRKWKPFVANRTSEILDTLPHKHWRYVPSKQNPADIASRGINPRNISNCALWWHGPSFLSMDESTWPQQMPIKSNCETIVDDELKPKSVFSVTTLNSNECLNTLFENCSSLSKIINIISFSLRFIFRCRERVTGVVSNDGNSSSVSILSANERQHALKLILIWVQSLYFQEEVKKLNENIPLSPKSTIATLCPFLDNEGILRVGGRLQNAQLSFNAKHPIIIPGQHKIAHLIIKQFHITHLHAGPSLLSNILKQNYWIVKGKKLIHKFIHECIVCHRYKITANNQLMGNLPTQRVTLERPFFSCGIDYAGPVILKYNTGRGTKTTKGYIALFVCLATKAFHIEAVSDLTADAFIAAFRRFVSRRGLPRYLFSDNGKNFVGAKRKLSDLHAFLLSITSNELILNYISQSGIEWKMIPPASPHFGGLWESGIKSIKFHLKRITSETKLTFEEISTLLVQIEAVLNSRPLSKTNYSDTSSINVLTPSHFLTGDVITNIPEKDLINTKTTLLKRWELLQQMKQSFWKRYYKEYLNSLQQRYKWKKQLPNLSVGDVVLIREDNMPPGIWPKGRISEIHPGKDGNVRVVTLKTVNGYFKRPIVKLSPLPIYQE